MSEHSSCSKEKSEESLLNERMNRLCAAIEQQATAITNLTSAVGEMVAATVDIQEQLASTEMDDSDGLEHMDMPPPELV